MPHFVAEIYFRDHLPQIEEILSEVNRLSGLQVLIDDNNLSHPLLKRGVGIYYDLEENRVDVDSGFSSGYYLQAVAIRSLLNLGGTMVDRYRIPKWSLKKLDEIRWWEFPKL